MNEKYTFLKSINCSSENDIFQAHAHGESELNSVNTKHNIQQDIKQGEIEFQPDKNLPQSPKDSSIQEVDNQCQETQKFDRETNDTDKQLLWQWQHTQKALNQTQCRLQECKVEIRNLHIQLKETKQVITAMESSLFWKLRLKWFKLRNIFNLTNDNLPIIVNLWLYLKQIMPFASKAKILDKNQPDKENINKENINKENIGEKIGANQVSVNLEIKPEIPLSDDINYQKWLQQNHPTSATLKRLAETLDIFPYQPVITLILLINNTSEESLHNNYLKNTYLQQTIESVLNQVYPHWELYIICQTSANNKNLDNQIIEKLNFYAAKDLRINIKTRLNTIPSENLDSIAYNSIFSVAKGEFIGLLHNHDLITPDALYEIALLLNKYPQADMIYSDEDKIDNSDKLKQPFFKPDWCPDSFLSRMYTSNLAIYRRNLINTIGGFRQEYEDCYEYDLILRLTEISLNIFHIPKILYHSRDNQNIYTQTKDNKNKNNLVNIIEETQLFCSKQQALLEAVNRRGEKAKVIQNKYFNSYIIRYEITEKKLVSIIIPTRDLGEILDKCLASIFNQTTYSNYEIIVIDNGSEEDYTAKVISKWKQKEANRFSCHQLDIPFNYSKINNYAVSFAKGDYLLFLNNDIEIITPDWIDAMVEQAQRVSIGAVGGLLLYPDNTIQHAGVVMGIGGVAGHSHQYFSSNSPGYFGQIMTINNYSAVTAACLMCRREVFESVGGFEEKLAVAFNDVDLCLKMLERNYKNIYLPHVVLYHYESKSRGDEDTPEKITRFNQEVEYMCKKWEEYIDFDPCYNPHLTITKQDYSIK
jgi:O-antigen biosynthesis protein